MYLKMKMKAWFYSWYGSNCGSEESSEKKETLEKQEDVIGCWCAALDRRGEAMRVEALRKRRTSWPAMTGGPEAGVDELH
jgi:hypothetical protein